ncbi:MAG: glycosyltransferase family 4 protein [Polyangiaceae bacterium]|nr:glycosyltransferase family 4 protein [Polyangiaceae bacterium]MBK8938861.1 glycosyltransferase family 4 protein [Polyangiaceae bacterium]
MPDRRADGAPVRVLCVTRIFPNRVEPSFGPYNKRQLAALRELGWEVTVLNPVPWFPGAGLLRGRTRASVAGEVPREDEIAGLPVRHPRFLHVPRFAAVHAPLYAAGVLPDVERMRGRFDVILSPFAYPDGVASILLGKLLGVPVVVKLHGGDMNVAAKNPPVGRWLRRTFPTVSRIIAVSYPLAEAAHSFGVPWSRLVVVEDGVDSAVFHPRDKVEAKRDVGLDPARRHIVYVGRLERRKGVYELMDAFDQVALRHPDVDLVLVGDGEDTEACKTWAQGLADRVVMTGTLGIDDVARYYAASDLSTLPSYAEGTPNCVIESLACGRPVVATAVGGVPDMLHDVRMGELIPPKDVPALTAALERALERSYDAQQIVRLTGRGTWRDSARHLGDVLSGAVEQP